MKVHIIGTFHVEYSNIRITYHIGRVDGKWRVWAIDRPYVGAEPIFIAEGKDECQPYATLMGMTIC